MAAVMAALGVGVVVASFSDVTVGTAAGAVAFAAFGTCAVALALLRSPPLATRVPPLRRQVRSLFPAAFLRRSRPGDRPGGLAGGARPRARPQPVPRADRRAPRSRSSRSCSSTSCSSRACSPVPTEALAATAVGADAALARWVSAELGRRRLRAVCAVTALVAGVAGTAALLSALELATALTVGFFAASFAGYAVVGVLRVSC